MALFAEGARFAVTKAGAPKQGHGVVFSCATDAASNKSICKVAIFDATALADEFGMLAAKESQQPPLSAADTARKATLLGQATSFDDIDRAQALKFVRAGAALGEMGKEPVLPAVDPLIGTKMKDAPVVLEGGDGSMETMAFGTITLKVGDKYKVVDDADSSKSALLPASFVTRFKAPAGGGPPPPPVVTVDLAGEGCSSALLAALRLLPATRAALLAPDIIVESELITVLGRVAQCAPLLALLPLVPIANRPKAIAASAKTLSGLLDGKAMGALPTDANALGDAFQATIDGVVRPSLRIGGATALFADGADETVIRTMGRWCSDIHRLYVRACFERCCEWTRRAGSVVVTDVARIIDEDDEDE